MGLLIGRLVKQLSETPPNNHTRAAFGRLFLCISTFELSYAALKNQDTRRPKAKIIPSQELEISLVIFPCNDKIGLTY